MSNDALLPTRPKVLATPAVRRLCRELSIDLSREPVSGTGPGGRVLKGDVLVYAENRTATSHGTAGAGTSAENGGARSGTNGEVVGPFQRAGLEGLVAYGEQADPPPAAFHGDDDGLGSLSEVAGGRSCVPLRLEDGGARRIVSGSEAVGVEVVEEEQGPPGEISQPRRSATVRQRKEPVSVPIKGEREESALAGTSISSDYATLVARARECPGGITLIFPNPQRKFTR